MSINDSNKLGASSSNLTSLKVQKRVLESTWNKPYDNSNSFTNSQNISVPEGHFYLKWLKCWIVGIESGKPYLQETKIFDIWQDKDGDFISINYFHEWWTLHFEREYAENDFSIQKQKCVSMIGRVAREEIESILHMSCDDSPLDNVPENEITNLMKNILWNPNDSSDWKEYI